MPNEVLLQIEELLTGPRASLYETGVQVTLLWERPERQQHLLTKIAFTRKGSEVPSNEVHRYKDALILQRALSVHDTLSIIAELATEGRLWYGSSGVVPLQGQLRAEVSDSPRRLRSEWSGWPAGIFVFNPVNASWTNSPTNLSLVARDAPYYPSLEQLLRDEFGIRTLSWAQYFNGQVVIVLPDFRGRISTVTIAQNYLQAQFECTSMEPSDLVVKIYAENATGPLSRDTIDPCEFTVRIDLPDKPTFASIALLAKASQEMLDEKRYQENIRWLPPGVVLKTSENEIEQMLLNGEGETVEFKERVEDGRNVAKTAVAFANTRGGSIVVGVSNDGSVVGCDPKGLSDRITNVLRDRCDPFPSFTPEIVSYRDKTIFLVRVPPSEEKVFVVRDEGPYIRANATNRTPTSQELENLLHRRESLGQLPASNPWIG